MAKMGMSLGQLATLCEKCQNLTKQKKIKHRDVYKVSHSIMLKKCAYEFNLRRCDVVGLIKNNISHILSQLMLSL